MGIVKISNRMHANLRVGSAALNRSINAQAEHWMRIGMLSELHPDLRYSDICQLLINAAQSGELDISGAGEAEHKNALALSPEDAREALQ
ncbi:MAG: ParD-like family protein [Zoogloea sp.]|nr:ParD-like family protein [Zoogloea sp.]